MGSCPFSSIKAERQESKIKGESNMYVATVSRLANTSSADYMEKKPCKVK